MTICSGIRKKRIGISAAARCFSILFLWFRHPLKMTSCSFFEREGRSKQNGVTYRLTKVQKKVLKYWASSAFHERKRLANETLTFWGFPWKNFFRHIVFTLRKNMAETNHVKFLKKWYYFSFGFFGCKWIFSAPNIIFMSSRKVDSDYLWLGFPWHILELLGIFILDSQNLTYFFGVF